MFALARLSVVGFVVLTIVYICLSLYSLSKRREKLEAEWDREGMSGDRDAFSKFVTGVVCGVLVE